MIFPIILAWNLNCVQYRGAIERLYSDPFFAKEENKDHRSQLHEFFKQKTFPYCLEVDV